ncbi:hypothetical protein SCP_1003720 [Sparassis crispa]|uniref:Transposase domain-containing protein n=1 Tax=Sparassis crispa TaxID=139825 RepID=A0A401GY21_9APHY|nr:hypothetical protein SCP_1003720 [Sparassis crispa]GBE87125.1 hypothetical protein SCP_1003720 [Sparassis crispa]
MVSRSTERRHRAGKVAPRIHALSALNRQVFKNLKKHQAAVEVELDIEYSETDDAAPDVRALDEKLDAVPIPMDVGYAAGPNGPQYRGGDEAGQEVEPEDSAVQSAVATAQTETWCRHTQCAQVDDEEGETSDDEDEAEDYSSESNSDSDDDTDDEGGLTVWDWMGAEFEARAMAIEEELNEEDKAMLRAFALKADSHMMTQTYVKLPFAFPNEHIPTLGQAKSRIAFLSGIKPQLYDCCRNSCCCFVVPHAELETCPYCHLDRYRADRKPYKQYTYLPLIPRLKAFHVNTLMAKSMQYRAEEHKHDLNVIKDVFDSEIYRSLCGQPVIVNGKPLKHRYFEDSRDIALGLSTDGFAPFKRRKQTAWPLIAYNYNLPPEVRFHKKNIIPIAVIPGPKKLANFDSFLWPLAEEMLRLAVGVRAWDVLTAAMFVLHAFLILVGGDIPAISMIMCMKGHNGYAPCRMCKIVGVQVPNAPRSPYYVPLDRSRHPAPGAIISYDPAALPKCTHEDILTQACEVQSARTDAEAERLAKAYGIKGVPLLSCLSSLSFPLSFPYNFMHLIWENVIKNLVLLWTGEFKGLDEGNEEYQLHPDMWTAISATTAAAGSTIPSAFGPRIPDPATDKSASTADSWSLWSLYVGPVLLARKFTRPKYYEHFIELVKLLHMCLEFEISRQDIAIVRAGFIKWVTTYERIYYQHSPERLGICPVTIHALLHIADSIETASPVWACWSFPMEHFCGYLQPAIKSRHFPFASIDRYLIDSACLEHIKMLYGMEKELALKPTASMSGLAVAEYNRCLLLPPHRTADMKTTPLIEKIVGALATRFNVTARVARHALPEQIKLWGKVRILPDGDTIHAAALSKPREDRCDATYVRYEVLVDKNARFHCRRVALEIHTFYGQLQHIFAVRLAPSQPLQLTKPTTLILATIKSCRIERSHNTLDIHFFSDTGAVDVIDISCIQCVIGRVPDGDHWAIIDHSGSLACAVYADEVED